jgi:hypothetical protein
MDLLTHPFLELVIAALCLPIGWCAWWLGGQSMKDVCWHCHQPEPDPSQRWPCGDGYLCQDCWEATAAAAWWPVAEATTKAAEAAGEKRD